MDLDPDDPFDAAVMEMVRINRSKRHDYANPVNIFDNFEVNAQMMGLPGYDRKEDCFSMVTRKVSRIRNLRGRDAQHESVVDSYLDLAVYAALLYAMAKQEADAVTDGFE
jgi:hypothetical protein